MTARDHMARVRALPCVVCVTMGMAQKTPTAAHHIESVRDDVSDFATAALCHDHHQGPLGVHGLSRRGFEMRYKLSALDLLAITNKLLESSRK